MLSILSKSLRSLLLVLPIVCGGNGFARADGAEPLHSTQIPDLYQRIITLPGAKLYDDRRVQVIKDQLPVFQVYYVYDRQSYAGKEWLQVGRSFSSPEGWIPADATQAWDLMMVMKYAPRGMHRQRVLFFEDDPKDPSHVPPALRALIDDFNVEEHAKALLSKVEAGDLKDSGLAAVETDPPPEERKSPYLMPILDFQRATFERGAVSTTLLRMASVNADQSSAEVVDPGPAIIKEKEAVVFVFDTTVSMKPYIEEARRFAASIYNGLSARGLEHRVVFGLVGYRDFKKEEPQKSGVGAKKGCYGLEYVSKIYQDLSIDNPPKMIVDSLNQMDVACVPTRGWNEDAIAGLYSAINDLDWDLVGRKAAAGEPPPVVLKMIILVTDAGARDVGDEKAAMNKTGILTIQHLANEDHIVIVPIHLHTPEAVKAKNIATAEEQYKKLGFTGDVNLPKYFGLESKGSEPVPEFRQQLERLAGTILDAMQAAAKGIPQEKPIAPKQSNEPLNLGTLFKNELYSAQQRYLGALQGSRAPAFYRAWASDRDLADPHPLRNALLVSVFLTRNQLSELAKNVAYLLDLAKRGEKGPQDFFNELRKLAASTVGDPNRKLRELLPAYLEKLPYKSDFLQMTEEEWTSENLMRQQEQIEQLEAKRTFYDQIDKDASKWIDVGAEDPKQTVSLMPLAVLP
jgi:serine/threonine-protein kinase PpkA